MPLKETIGTKYMTYLEERCIALPFEGYDVKRKRDIYVLLAAIYLRLTGVAKTEWVNLHNDLNTDNCCGYHFWNAASHSSKPWVTTLELPTRDDVTLKLFASNQCKKILCLSSWVLSTQQGIVRNSKYSNEVLPKLKLLHPPQKIHRKENELLPSRAVQKLKFIFVGRDFFRKGGFECVKAFDSLLESGHDIELKVVSKLDLNDWPQNAPKSSLQQALQLIDKWRNNIHIFREVSHAEVIELISESHVGLLPTYLDSYGFSTLEFFSLGVPVITTKIRAQSEINSDERGWFLNLPTTIDEYGVRSFDRSTLQKREQLSKLLTEALCKQIHEIVNDKHEIEEKGILALKYVKKFHDIEQYQRTLEEIYSSF